MRLDAVITPVLLASVLPVAAQTAARRALPTAAAAPLTEPALAPAEPTQPIRFGLALPLRDRAGLEALVRGQKDPASPQYRRFLSSAEFQARFSPTQADYDKVVAYAKAQGFTVTQTFANRLLVSVSAPPAAVNKAFAVTMQMHQRAGEARQYHAPDVEPTVASGVPILSVSGLSDRVLPRPMLKHAPRPQTTTGSGQGGQFLGSDIRTAYVGASTLAGEGQTVGLLEFGPYNVSDVTSYFSTIRQPLHVPIYNALVGGVDGVCAGTPATGGCDDGEEVIDIQQAISMAPALAGLIIYETYGGADGLGIFAQAASDNIAKSLSLSFGFGGTPATQPGYEQVFLEMQAQGQNLFIASGDGGAFPGDGGYPGNSPNVVDVGGTDLVTAGAGGPWQSETAWIGSGGGWNTASPIPGYQTAAINSANAGNPNFRNVPDVAAEANTDNFFCANGGCSTGIGGTSLAAPRWAGFLSLVNEQADGRPVPFLNSLVYPLGQTAGYAAALHDITAGNNFNAASPNLFQAVPGYDLTSGWGSPNGQGFLDAAAPPAFNQTAPNFSLAAAPAALNLTPGATGTATLTLASANGFSGAVSLNATLIGAPAGVTATLGSPTLNGAGQTTITVATTGATPGGNYLLAVTGTADGLTHTAYVRLALPDFALTGTPATVYLNQRGSATDTLSVEALNGFASAVSLALGALPPGLSAAFAPRQTASTSTLTLSAGVLAPTTPGRSLQVTGAAGSTTRTLPSLTAAVSAAAGECGLGEFIDFGPYFNLSALRTDGTAATDGGLDGSGSAFSANLLGPGRVLNGIRYRFGAANALNGVSLNGQTVPLPHIFSNALGLVGTAINGLQQGEAFTVTYTDGTSETYAQSFSDWFAPDPNVNEGEAAAFPYRLRAAGTQDARQFNAYGYTLALNPRKLPASLTLPVNRNVVLLAGTLSLQPFGTQVNLAGAFNATGVYTDGTQFAGDGGLDAGGAAYSGTLLQDGTTELVTAGNTRFRIAAANTPNTVYAAGQTIPLPGGFYSNLKLLGAGVQGDQTDQPLTVRFTDGTTQTFRQSFSDWSAIGAYPNESVAVRTPYRDYNDGSRDNQAFYVYQYTLTLPPFKTVQSLTLPNNRNVVLLGITLDPPSVFDLEPAVCSIFGQ